MTLYDGAVFDETERGDLNPSSYAARNMVGVVAMAMEQIERAEQQMTPKRVRAVAATLAFVIDSAQHELVGDVDRQAASYALLRKSLAATLTSLPVMPMTANESAEATSTWAARATKRVMSVVTTAHALWGTKFTSSDTPWDDLFD